MQQSHVHMADLCSGLGYLGHFHLRYGICFVLTALRNSSWSRQQREVIMTRTNENQLICFSLVIRAGNVSCKRLVVTCLNYYVRRALLQSPQLQLHTFIGEASSKATQLFSSFTLACLPVSSLLALSKRLLASRSAASLGVTTCKHAPVSRPSLTMTLRPADHSI